VPTDPRLGGVVLGITDPQMVALASLRQEVADLRREVRDQRSAATIQEVAGTPTVASRNGTPAVDTSAARLWIRRNGAWQFATLT
jgi:hypothetical protein